MRLELDTALVDEAFALADDIAAPVVDFARRHTTVAIERTVARLFGVDGVDDLGVPLPNVLVDALGPRLGEGLALPLAATCAATGRTPQQVAEAIAAGELSLAEKPGSDPDFSLAASLAAEGDRRIAARRSEREAMVAEFGDPPTPWLYVIVATGNIHEDARQAQAAARAGADVIAVIRSTAQSLIDYVPYGETTEGFGGTYATQANFRLVRAALDEVIPELGRYVRLTNYASGLCMPEIAACGAVERLDMMLNDSMYGILFRDINPQRTFCDQYVSRMINGRAGVIINTGEDNYLTTAPGHEAGHTVVAQQLHQPLAGAGRRHPRAADRARPRVRDRSRPAGPGDGGVGRRAAHPRAVPGLPDQVHAADQARHRRHLPHPVAGDDVQPGRRRHRPAHPAAVDPDRGGAHALPGRPDAGDPGCAARVRGRPPAARLAAGRARRPAGRAREAGAGADGRPAAQGGRRSACSRRSSAAGSPTRPARATAAAAWRAWPCASPATTTRSSSCGSRRRV